MKRKPWEHKLTTTQRGLGWAWQKQRLRILKRDDYLCQDCLTHSRVTAATEVHHLVPRSEAGPQLAKDEHCLSLCPECHRARDDALQGRKAATAFDSDGRVVW